MHTEPNLRFDILPIAACESTTTNEVPHILSESSRTIML